MFYYKDTKTNYVIASTKEVTAPTYIEITEAEYKEAVKEVNNVLFK